jgi:hypothetical protein
MHPTPDHSAIAQSSHISNDSMVAFIGEWLLQKAQRSVLNTWKFAKGWAIGDKDAFYRLTGPGDFYITSRTQPRLSGLIQYVLHVRVDVLTSR